MVKRLILAKLGLSKSNRRQADTRLGLDSLLDATIKEFDGLTTGVRIVMFQSTAGMLQGFLRDIFNPSLKSLVSHKAWQGSDPWVAYCFLLELAELQYTRVDHILVKASASQPIRQMVFSGVSSASYHGCILAIAKKFRSQVELCLSDPSAPEPSLDTEELTILNAGFDREIILAEPEIWDREIADRECRQPAVISQEVPRKRGRPAAVKDRNDVWLKWSGPPESLTPAMIRDRWNGLSEDERRGISPAGWQKFDEDLNQACDTVEKGLAEAKRRAGER